MDDKTIPTIFRKNLPPHLEKIKNTPQNPDDLNYPVHMYYKENDIRVEEKGSDIVNFLKGKNILITGATGFLGKLLVEKLLRCSEDIGTLYIIIRSKKGVSPESRIKEYLDNWVFIKLAEIRPNFREKVVAISGDFEKDGLELTEEAKEIIRTKVNIIYHIAATVRFDEHLTRAVNINIRGTQQLLRLAKECKYLDVFLYMSTAFSNCSKKHIDEVFYPPYMDPYKLMNAVGELPDDVVSRITPGLIGEIPNTYAFTKQIAEDLVRREGAGLPLCIQRPSIVIASVREPIKAWIDNIFGPVGLMQGGAMGVVHIFYGRGNGRCDLVPADYTVNHCIACSYQTAMSNKDGQIQKEIPIYNFTSSDDNPLKWKNLGKARRQGLKLGSTKVIMRPFGRVTSCWYWYLLVRFWLETVPSYILDFLAPMMGQKPMLRYAYTRIHRFMEVLTYFTYNEWTFSYQHTTDLWEKLNEVDKKNFAFDMKSLDWDEYFVTYCVTLREVLMKESLDNLEEGQYHMKKVNITFYVVVTLVLGSSVYFLLNTIFFFIPLMFLSFVLFYYIADSE